MERLLKLLDTNARLTTAEMATMLGTTEDAVKAQMAELEKAGVVRGYKALIDWDRTDRKYVTALIELRVTPQRNCGFDDLAERIMKFEEVETVNLVQQNQRVLHACTAKSCHNSSRHGAHISPPVSANLRLVPHASQ